MIYFYLECDALDNDIRSLFMAFYPGRAIKRIETKEYACAEGDLFLRVCMSDCAETQCLANEDNTKKKMTMELVQDGTLLDDACECELSDRKDTKTKAKCMLYCLLSKLTKKELPWGTLTGIRPTKIARTMLMEGASDEECIDYMKNQMLCGEEKTMLSLDIAKREIKLLDCLDYKDGYSLYVGIAFCPTTCAYCSFTSYPVSRFGDRVDAYLDSIEKEIEYKNINKIMSEEREKSLKDFKDAIFNNTKNNINNLNIKLECAGCRMCEQICPKNAIKMEDDEEGFLRPVVDEDLCINCGLCIKRCPQRNEVEKSRENQTAYAAKIKNIDTLKNSSSGGVFSVLANEYIKNNGKVYGAAYDENFNVMHIGVDTLEGLKKIRGSKYVQSNTLDTYSNVKKDLQEGKQVLYSGTACQIAGLNKFLDKNYENLLTVDIVCHGVPSQKLFKKYKEYIENKYNGRIEEISFRNKEKRGWGLNLKIKLDNGKIIRKFAYIDPYYKAFVNGDIYRECCYNCKYANSNRVGDITLADYWGVANVHPEFYDGKGVSAVIVNNQKGIDTWNKVKDELEYIETSVEFIKKYNPNLVKPTYRKKSRDYIYNKLDEKDFKKFIKENLKFKKKFKDTIRSKFSDEDIERLKGKLKK